MKQAVLGIAFALALIVGVNSVYAENGLVDYPKISDDGMIGQDVQVTYQTDNRWTVTVTTQFQVDDPIELPDVIYYPAIDGQIYSINVKEGFILANDKSQYNSSEEITVEQPVDTITIEDKREEQADIKEEVWGKFRVCMEEFEVEQPVRFDAWKRTATLTEFDIPVDGSIAYDTANYQTEELKGERAWQICEAIKKYKWIGVVEANKSMAENEQGFVLDETNAPETPEPVTQEDKDVEAKRAAEFACSEQGRQQGLCISHFAGEVYVPKWDRLPAWYGEYLNTRDTTNDAEEAVARSLLTQCTNYYPLYEHKVGMDSFPEWLNHCIGTQ